MRIQTNYYSIQSYSNLLVIRTFSSWDDRVTIKHIEDVKNIILQQFQNKPWAILSDRRKWQLNTPEAERLFKQMPKTILTGTLTHSAIVVGTSKIKKWQVSNMIKNAESYETKIFKKVIDAEDWLASYGYTASQE